jgi:hypothetical protein
MSHSVNVAWLGEGVSVAQMHALEDAWDLLVVDEEWRAWKRAHLVPAGPLLYLAVRDGIDKRAPAGRLPRASFETSTRSGPRPPDVRPHRSCRSASEPNRRLLRLILVIVRLASVLAIAALALGGCGAAEGEDPTPHSDVTAADAAVALVDEADADLVLIVSNQSFDDEEVRLTVTVDGATVVDGDFHVEDQHNWVYFPLKVPAGGHEVIAQSDSGAALRESFELPPNGTRYAIIEHWTEDDSAQTDDAPVDLTWELQRRAPAFG